MPAIAFFSLLHSITGVVTVRKKNTMLLLENNFYELEKPA